MLHRSHPGRRVLTPVVLTALAALCAAGTAVAQTAPVPAGSDVAALRAEIAALRAEYEERLQALEQKLAALAAAPPAPATVPEPAPVPPAPPPAQTANYFNPAISLIGNFLSVGGQGKHGDLASADLRESEIGLQAIVDPYARADVFLALGEEGVEVEEGYVTLTSLPDQFLAKIGRMRTQFGKVNGLHLHVLPWPDEPLPVVNLLGGEEGWVGTGVAMSRLLPLGDTFSEITLQGMRGDAEGLFEARKPSDLAWNGHYRLFRDLTDASNLDLGLSYARGPNASRDGAHTALQGVDLTYRWKPLQTGLYRSATFRGEVYRSQREQPGGRQDALGWYVSGDYQFAKRWSAGARLESSERADDETLRDTGQALLLTFSPSEFLQLRGELRRRRFAEDYTTNAFLLQLQFAIGAHGAHPF